MSDPREGLHPEPVFDSSALSALAGLPSRPGEEPFVPKTIGVYLRTTPHLIEDLTAALGRDEVDGMRRAAHTLKSSSAIVGARALSAAARQLEIEASSGTLGDASAKVAHMVTLFGATCEALARFRDATLAEHAARS